MTLVDQAVEQIRPWWTQELEDLVRAVGGMFALVERYAADSDAGVGWSVMLDPLRCPAEALPYLAQWIGERLPVGISEAGARQWILDAPNSHRGTPYSIARVAQRWLTGSKTMFIRERSRLDLTDDADAVALITYAAETPSQAQVLAELQKAVPGDIVIYYETAAGFTWANAEATYATWTALAAANATWGDLAARPPSFTGFTPWYR